MSHTIVISSWLTCILLEWHSPFSRVCAYNTRTQWSIICWG